MNRRLLKYFLISYASLLQGFPVIVALDLAINAGRLTLKILYFSQWTLSFLLILTVVFPLLGLLMSTIHEVLIYSFKKVLYFRLLLVFVAGVDLKLGLGLLGLIDVLLGNLCPKEVFFTAELLDGGELSCALFWGFLLVILSLVRVWLHGAQYATTEVLLFLMYMLPTLSYVNFCFFTAEIVECSVLGGMVLKELKQSVKLPVMGSSSELVFQKKPQHTLSEDGFGYLLARGGLSLDQLRYSVNPASTKVQLRHLNTFFSLWQENLFVLEKVSSCIKSDAFFREQLLRDLQSTHQAMVSGDIVKGHIGDVSAEKADAFLRSYFLFVATAPHCLDIIAMFDVGQSSFSFCNKGLSLSSVTKYVDEVIAVDLFLPTLGQPDLVVTRPHSPRQGDFLIGKVVEGQYVAEGAFEVKTKRSYGRGIELHHFFNPRTKLTLSLDGREVPFTNLHFYKNVEDACESHFKELSQEVEQKSRGRVKLVKYLKSEQ